MKHKLKTRLLSLLLCFSMVISVLAHVTPVYSADETETTTEETQNTLEANVGKQAIFDWWSDFLLIDEETLMNSTSDALYDYYYADANWVSYDDIPADDLILKIIDYFYDEENGNHWYKVGARDGETLPEVLQEKPWVYYANDADFEEDIDPYLVVYDKNDTIRFVSASINGTDVVRFVLSSASEALTDAIIEITDYDGDYTVSSLAYIYEGNVAWSNAHQVQITKANGEAWSSTDGNVGIRYTSANVAGDTYGDDISYASAFLYVDETVYSAAVTDKGGNVVSDIVYTNAGSSVIVYEFLDPSLKWVNETGYFTNDAVPLYDNSLANSKNSLAAELPTTFTVGYSFTDANATEWYWLVSDELIGSPYFLVEAEYVTLGELPEAFGDGRVSIADEEGNAVSAITLPIYEKQEFAAVSSLSQLTAGVSYQWQIEYEDGKWVDIYGEDEATIKLSYSMVATLLDENGSVNIRCKSTSGSLVAYSAIIPVTVEMYTPSEDVILSDNFTTSSGETVMVTVSGNLPEDSSLALEEADSTGVEIGEGETVAAAFDISVKNADGSEWQPKSGETVSVTLSAAACGLEEGDTYVIYHLHGTEIEMMGPYTVDGENITFTVDGFSKFVFALTADGVEIETPDYSGDVGKYATLIQVEEGTVLILESEPTEENVSDPMVFDYTEFPADIVFSIDACKVVTESYDLTDETTGEVTGQAVIQGLWYQVSVVSGTAPEGFADGYWIFQNYLTEGDSYENDTLNLYTPEEEPDEPSCTVSMGGEKVTEITVNTSDAVTLVADSTISSDAVEFAWQILIPGTETWVEITGESEATCDITYDMVSGMADENGVAYIRCVSSSLSTVLESDVIKVNVVSTYAASFARSGLRARSGGVMLAAEEKADSYTVIFNYIFENGVEAADSVQYTITPTISLTGEIVFPEVLGYSAYLDGKPIDRYEVNFIYSEMTEDITVNVVYLPALVNYTVHIMVQNVYDDEYTEIDVLTLQALTESTVPKFDLSQTDLTDEEKAYYAGLRQLNHAQPTVAADGSTKIEVKFNRRYYLMTFELGEGGYGVQPVYARYETEVTVPNPTRPGYIFMGWSADNGPYSDGNNETVDITSFTNIKMPAQSTSYTAIWQAADTAKVSVVIWGQNADDDNYSYMSDKSFELQVKPGSNLTYTVGGYVCGYDEEHTHGEDCDTSCGLEEHTHSAIGGNCYSTDHDEHLEHSESCYKCGLTESSHTHGKECYPSSDYLQNAQYAYNFNPPSNPVNGQVYIDNEGFMGSARYFVYINGTWYRAIQGYDDYDSGSIVSPTCGNVESSHLHSNDCVDTTKCSGIHEHADSCYELTCQETVHAHTEACYKGCTKEEHTHGSGCTITDPMDSSLWTYEKSDTITVAADGSSVLNVYYVRKTFTITFHYNRSGGSYQSTSTITDRWGADIGTRFLAVNDTANGNLWSEATIGEDPWTSYLQIMPQRNVDYYCKYTSDSPQSAEYYTQNLDGTYKLEYTVNAYYDEGNLTISKEDFYEMEGFTYSHGIDGDGDSMPSPGSYGDFAGAKFYYTRNTYHLEFNSGEISVRDEYPAFEQSLAEYATYTLDASQAPSKYAPGSVRFAGWYYNPECTREVDFSNLTMPAGDLIVYAKWELVTHNVTFWTYKDTNGTLMDKITYDGFSNPQTVTHGEKLQEQYIPEAPTDFKNGNYIFDGWYYMENGTENRFDFETMTVVKDMDVYAKWTSDTLMTYRFYYKDENGTELAPMTEGTALAGETVTQDAKAIQGYYPNTNSHSLLMDINDQDGVVEFTFVYTPGTIMPYTVKYLNATTGEPVATERYVADNTFSSVQEKFVPVTGMKPDAYQKSLILSADETQNVIIFYYSESTDNSAVYQVTHYTQSTDGTSWLVYREEDGVGTVGNTVTATPLSIAGFTFDSSVEGTLTSATLTEAGVELKLYYVRNKYPYKVEYRIDNAEKTLLGEDLFISAEQLAYYQDVIQINAAHSFEGYDRITNSPLTMTIRAEEEADLQNPKNNVVTFWYKEKTATITYVPVGVGYVTPTSETISVVTGTVIGSTAIPNDNCKFVGWYLDAECEREVPSDWVDANGKIVPQRSGTLWENATYYAKFEYNLISLTIDKAFPEDADYSMDVNQSFLFDVVEVDENGAAISDGANLTVTVHGDGSITIDGLTVGSYYKITEQTDWSWRYEECVPSSSLTGAKVDGNSITVQLTAVASANKVTFTNTRSEEKWLDGDSYKVNIFGTVQSQE